MDFLLPTVRLKTDLLRLPAGEDPVGHLQGKPLNSSLRKAFTPSVNTPAAAAVHDWREYLLHWLGGRGPPYSGLIPLHRPCGTLWQGTVELSSPAGIVDIYEQCFISEKGYEEV